MPKSILFLLHHENHPQELTEHRLLTLHHLQHERLPGDVLLSTPVESKWLRDSTPHEVAEIDNNTVVAFLMRAREDALLLLPEKPFRSWQKALLGNSKSSTVAFCLTVEPHSLDAALEWSLRDNDKIKLPPTQGTQENPAEAIRRILMKKEQRIEDSLLQLFQAIDAEEAPHKIRVNARTLRSLLDFLKPWTEKSLNKDLRNTLRDLARDFSDIREQDVLMQQISEYDAAYLGSLGHFDDIIEHIALERRDHMEDLLRNAITQNSLGIIPGLVSGLENLTLSGDNLAHDINERYYNLWIAFQVRASTHDYADVEGTHDLRKDAKRMRYVLENFSKWIPSVDADMAAHFKDIQTVLGDLCDARTNQDRLQAMNSEEALAWGEDRDTLLAHNQKWEDDILADLGVAPRHPHPEAEPQAPTGEAPSDPSPDAGEEPAPPQASPGGSGPIPKVHIPRSQPAWKTPLSLQERDETPQEADNQANPAIFPDRPFD